MEGRAVVRGTTASVMQDLLLALSSDHKSQVQAGPNDTLIIERTHVKAWVVLVCILLFPIGLLALLAPRGVDRGTVAVSDNPDGLVTMRMSGTFFKSTHAAIDAVIEQNSRP